MFIVSSDIWPRVSCQVNKQMLKLVFGGFHGYMNMIVFCHVGDW